MRFTQKARQKIIDDYLAKSGANMFVPAEFIDWLEDKPEHPCWKLWHGVDADEAKRKWMIDQVRTFVSGLRIVCSEQVITNSNVKSITVREYPAYISPAQNRQNGGGYVRFDPENAAAMAELQSQAAASLRVWLDRYRGAVEHSGHDVAPIEALAKALAGMEDKAA